VRPNSRKATDLTPLAACNGTRVTGQGRSTCTGALRCPPHDRRPPQALENFSWFGWMLDSPRSLGSGQAGRRPRLGSRVLRQAGDVYDRAARSPYGRVPQPTPAGNQPRHAARLLSAFACLTGCGSIISIVLVTRVGRARRSRRRTPRRPAGRRPGRRRSRRRRTAVRRRALDTACPADPAPDTACPARRTVFPRQLHHQRHKDSPDRAPGGPPRVRRLPPPRPRGPTR
jgi:hypothetical protein